ncbi:MAG: hypothetical protein HY322_17405 [Betaproteobacteria bacterium]|nr:hypothetical protein [Betaproteobacteria bacterium]
MENWRVLRQRWFDHWMKGIANGVDREPAVRLFLMGGGSERRNADGRLDVSSSNFPRYDVNPNTGEPEARARLKRVATNRVYVDAAHASHVALPIVPAAALKFLSSSEGG